MKQLCTVASLTVLVFGAATALAFAVPNQHSIGVKEYDAFHDVLHPLEHEALPKNDFTTIRSRAKELIKLGDAIVKLGVPRGAKPEHVEAFKKELDKFAEALVKFGADAKSGTDTQLKTSYSAVHDSFEELVGMLPRRTAQAGEKSKRTVIYDEVPTEVIAAAAEASSDLWITLNDLTRVTKFVIKPQGVCRDELCFTLPKNRKAAFVTKKGASTWFNLSEFARLIKQPFTSDPKNGVWYFGPLSQEQNYLASLEAPSFTLTDMNGRPHSLSDFRGKKVLLVTWASW